MQKIKSLISIATVLVAWIAFAAYILIGINADVLYTAEERNVFFGGEIFFNEMIAQPFGVFKYIGAFLTQLFYHPALGASVLIALWVAIILAGINAFRLKGAWTALMILPTACLLAATVDLGYWIYCLNIRGYWFSQSVAVLCLLLLLWAANATPRRYHIGWYMVIGVIAFPAFGWFSYLFVICLALAQWRKGSTPSWKDALGVILTAVTPLLFHALLYEGIPMPDVYLAGFPIFKTSTNESLRPSIPFIIMAGVLVMLSLSGVIARLRSDKSEEVTKKRLRTIATTALPLLLVAVSAYGVWTSMFKDDNYIYEMQMNRATMDDDWQSVISVAEKAECPSQTMVMLKNIALINTGELGERSFELGNNGINITNPDSLAVNIMQIASPAIYLNYGQYNYAMRWSMEFSVQYGFSAYYMKVLTRCAAATGEKKLEKRYTNFLHDMLFYKDWKTKPVSSCTKELSKVSGDILGWDENTCERYIIGSFMRARHPKSPLLTEVSLFYSLISRSPVNFWESFYNYVNTHKGKGIPKEYEEAYIVYTDNTNELSTIHIEPKGESIARYKKFWADIDGYNKMHMDEPAIGEATKEYWGDTFWWYVAFGRTKY